MNERSNQLIIARLDEKRLLDIAELCQYLSIGRNKAMELGKEIGAEIKIGRRCLYDRVKIDKYLDKQAFNRED